MTDDLRRRLIATLADRANRVPEAQVDPFAVAEGGRHLQRRRQALQVTGLVLAVAAIAIGASRTPLLGGSAESPAGQTSESPSPSPTQDPPPLFPSASECPAVAPEELPDGTPAGTARRYPHARLASFTLVWGTGPNAVSIARGVEAVRYYDTDDRAGFPSNSGEPVVGADRVTRWVIAVGDPPLGAIMYKLVVDDCPYLMWTADGMTWEAALAYAARSSTSKATTGVPDLGSVQAARAQELLEEAGLRMRRVEVMGTACRPEGIVLDQDPQPSVIAAWDSRVTVTVNGGAFGTCGLNLTAATPRLEQVAQDFLRYARTGGVPPIDTPVSLYLGGRLVETIPVSEEFDLATWRVCPPEGGYAGFVCPFSAVDDLRRHPGPIAITSEAPQHPCAHPQVIREATPDTAVTLTPDESLDCTSYFAVQLMVSDLGYVTGVNLVRSEP